MSAFSPQQLLILQSEQFFSNPSATLSKIFNFLELPDYQLPRYKIYNQGSYSPANTQEKRQYQELLQVLSKFFKPHNQKLEDYLGVKLNWE